MKPLKFVLGLFLAALMTFVPLSSWQPSPTNTLESLAVQLDGRKKPLDTVARETVTQLYGKDHYRASDGSKLNAIDTFMALWFNDRDWNQEPIILANYRPLKAEVGLDPERKYFSFSELMRSQLPQVFTQVRQKQAAGSTLDRRDREALTVADRMSLMLDTVANESLPLLPHPSNPKGTWLGLNSARTYYDAAEIADIQATLQMMQLTYDRHGEAAIIEPLAATLHDNLQALSPEVYPSDRTLKREVFFNHFHAFGKTWHSFAIGLILLLAVVLVPLDDWYDVPLGVFAGGLLLQAYGFALRIQVADRPPVTNMYESVIWVGFGITALALAFELRTRARYYLLAAAPLSIAALLLADSLPAVLDASIQPLVPVLRDNFWLSIHVPTITLSYACFALAMGLGHILLGHYLLMPTPLASGASTSAIQRRIQRLQKLNYSVLQVGVLLLAAGIILGGIWAHFSWGRFWGWDPKETWAAIALLCYLLPLHGRFVGWVKPFGMAIASVVSFNAVLMAWYGVNFVLGQGLHSYGFGTGGTVWVAGIVLADLSLVAIVTARHLWAQSQVRPSSNDGNNNEDNSVAMSSP